MLALFTYQYATEIVLASGWQRNHFQRNNTLSANEKLKLVPARLIDGVGKVIDNNNNSGLSSVLVRKPILVLYWTRPKWWSDDASPLRSCPEVDGQCEFTSDLSRTNESDILLFHNRHALNLPPRHLPHQKWVFSGRESPVHVFANLPRLQGVFNMTMTYTRSAMAHGSGHVPWFYGRCEPLSPIAHRNYSKTFNYAAKKKHLVAWFVSNCRTPSRRETYEQALGKHIDVHMHGCGGKYSCPKGNNKVCHGRLLNDNYKFYLSFENSLCFDYVTEKLWRILEINVVPVVLGRANYSFILPPHSYIDVRDFASPHHLADYLKLLDGNDTLYNEYFRWKAKYVCMESHDENECNLCRHALANRGQTEVVTDLVAELGRTRNCIDAVQFYRGMGVHV